MFTGIGHERDSTVLDEVAHRRFDTPSKGIAGIEQPIAQRDRHAREHFGFVVHTARRALADGAQRSQALVCGFAIVRRTSSAVVTGAAGPPRWRS